MNTAPDAAGKSETKPEVDFLTSLKRRTQTQHVALENTRLSSLLMSPRLNKQQYLAILYGFYGAFEPLEKVLLGASMPSFHPRAHLAAADIHFLAGRLDDPLPSNPLPLPWQTISAPTTWGIRYVLEGSRLGGKVISRHLNATLGITPETGGAFFAGTDSPGLESWKVFKSQCTAYAAQHVGDQEEIIRAANDTFRYIQENFEAYYPKISV